MRLIDADALRLMKVEECAGHTIEYAAGWKACIEWIKTQPTIDAVPVKRGKWEMGVCSVCGGHAPYWSMATTYYESDYCPNCGADMRGGEDA